jgi:hypothetical protein
MLEPKMVFPRYEREAPGDLIHIDIKKFACIKKPSHRPTANPRDETRGAGWEFAHVAVDDHSRLAFVSMYPDEKAALGPTSWSALPASSPPSASPSAA